MSTAYTAEIKDGITFEQFALNCARNFGACITLRDEPAGGEHIPDEFVEDDYHVRAGQKAKAELEEVMSLTNEQREEKAEEEWKSAEARRIKGLENITSQRAAYVAMLARVESWTPPTSEHVGMKDFMLKQIRESIEWDCDESFYSEPAPKLPGLLWAGKKAAKLGADIAYHEKGHAEEVKLAAERTAWVKALRESLAAA